jgi:hypothetical protein
MRFTESPMIKPDYEAFQSRMHQQYPKIFSGDYRGFAIDEGWWPIVEGLCDSIQHYLKWRNRDGEEVQQVVVTQIKEKLGGLRFYYDGGDDRIRGMVDMAERWAEQTCEKCGAPGKFRNSTSWLKTLCDDHERERLERYRERMVTLPQFNKENEND